MDDDILIAVVDREIEVSSAAPKVVEVRDGCPSIVGEFRRISVRTAIPSVGRPGRRS